MNDTRPCPKCGAPLKVHKALEAPGMELDCRCGSKVRLLWKASSAHEENIYWFEDIHAHASAHAAPH